MISKVQNFIIELMFAKYDLLHFSLQKLLAFSLYQNKFLKFSL